MANPIENKNRLLKILDDRIYLAPNNSVLLDQTNLPLKKMRFRKGFEIYWVVEIVDYNKENKSILLEVKSYHPSGRSGFEGQKVDFPLNRIEFESLVYSGVENYLSETSNSLKNEFIFKPKRGYKGSLKEPATIPKIRIPTFSKNPNPDKPQFDIYEPFVRKFNEEFYYPFNDAEFYSGYVLVRREFDFTRNEIELLIYNHSLIPEYQYIRNYFPKALGSGNSFMVKATIELTNGKVSKVEAQSPEIERINESIIGKVRRHRTLELQEIDNDENGKKLYSASEAFSKLKESGEGGNIFTQDEEDILKIMLESSDIKNKDQIEYLAGNKHHPTRKIKLTLKPLFGFLFYIQGDKLDHFCWELLESHATYLWSIGKEKIVTDQFKIVEEAISIIHLSGRNKYKRAYRNGMVNKDIQFFAITHSSKEENRFLLWKNKLNEKLV